jgi:hypothetical protein
MRLIAVVFLAMSLMIPFQRCDYVDILHQENTIIVVDQWLDNFEEIVVEIPIELELEQTNDGVAVITGPDYKVDNLSMTIENNVLTIDEKSFTYERKDQVLNIKLPIKILRKITLNMPTILSSKGALSLDQFSLAVNGPGTYSESNLDLNCKSIYLGAYGKNSGHHILKGNTDELTLRLEGLAWTDAGQLISSKVTVIQRSLKNSYVHASDHLIVQMYSEGNVYYKGQPKLDFQIVQPDWNPEFGEAIKQGD